MSNIIFGLGIILIVLNIIFFIKIKREIKVFSKRISFIVEKLIDDEKIEFNINEENILSKLEYKVKRLCDSFEIKRKIIEKDKENIQGLVSDISHQVKTPLANISLYTETVLNRELDKEKINKCLNLVLEEEKKLNFLMEALIKSSRLENGIINVKKESINIKDILDEVLASVEGQAIKKNININKEVDEILVQADKKWIKEGVINIVENAIKYSHENSSIDIYVEKGEIFSSINIKDYGIGIRKENINNIFKRFFREEDVYEYEGVGIGLYLARSIIEELGGFIKVESVKGMGTIFKVYLLNITNL